MNDSLTMYNFSVNAYKMIDNSDEVIKDLIDGFSPDNAILKIFMKFQSYGDNTISYQDKFNYFYNLAHQIKRITNYNYSEDDILIYTLYVTSIYEKDQSQESIEKITGRLENIFNLVPTGENEEYAKIMVQYKLLHLYSNQMDTRYDDMKKLLDDLNSKKDYYNTIKTMVIGKIEEEGGL